MCETGRGSEAVGDLNGVGNGCMLVIHRLRFLGVGKHGHPTHGRHQPHDKQTQGPPAVQSHVFCKCLEFVYSSC